ncbi:MAG: hypothetical protein ACRDZX_02210 [Acidimicrobiales bacterium]
MDRSPGPYCLADLGGFGAAVDELWPLLVRAGVTCVAGNYDVAITRGDADCDCGYHDPKDKEYAQFVYDYTRAHTSAALAAWMRRQPTERLEMTVQSYFQPCSLALSIATG